jgi:sporulation protein YlmC with PRC-barrel domain
MKSGDILNLKVVNIENGASIGSVTKLLIDGEKIQMIALQIGGGMFSHADYILFNAIKAIKNDALMIESESSVVERGTFKNNGIIDNLLGKKTLTEDGRDIGTVHEFDVDIVNGDITSITVAIDKAMLGGLWQSAGDRFDVHRKNIVTLGDNVIVDKSIVDVTDTNK